MKNNKQIKKGFKYEDNQTEYTLKVRRKCKWCWLLLLLLLPLLLLIPLKRDIQFEVIDTYNNSPVSGIKVNFEYTKRDMFNFETYKFFTREYRYSAYAYTSDTTDANGIAIMKNIKFTLYQWIFRNNDITRAYANNECSSLDTTITLFKLKKTNTIYLYPTLKDIEFTVIDSTDGELLPDALVRIESDKYNYTDTMRSRPDGTVTFLKVPYCSNIKVEGTKYGWYKDNIDGKFKDHENDTLFLKQKLEIIKFYARDAQDTSVALVGAIGSVFLKSDPTNAIRDNIITNTRGVGKGVIDSMHIIKKIRIDVTHQPYYNDSSTVSYHLVEKWKNYSKEKQRIYLRPNPNPILFKNIDCKTGEALEGIENEITIISNNGDSKIAKKISNNDGEFSFSAKIGDKITIKSKSNKICPNKYNDTIVITNANFIDLKNDINKRKIPLCKKKATVQKFRNVDADDPSQGIQGVKNTIIIDGGVSFIKTSGIDGWFEIDNVYECQNITINADGTSVGYGTNTTKINPKKYSEIMSPTHLQDKRDIPLKANPIQVKFCDVDQNGNILFGATNDVYINGTLAYTRDGSCFFVEAKPDDKIKIIGKYDGQTNSTKVNGSQTLKELENASQSDRNIPFEELIPVLGCEGSDSGSNKDSKRKHDLQGCDSFTITWNLGDTHPDEIIIYCGTGATKRQIFTTGMITGTGSRTLKCSKKRIFIKVKANSDSGTSWSYHLKCNCN